MGKSKRKEKKEAVAKVKRELKEQRRQEKAAKKNCEFKPKGQSGKKALMIILWTIILFFSAKGLVMTFTAEDSESVKSTMDNHMEQLSDEKSIELEAGTFGKNFVYDYFTYTENGGEEWLSKMKKYSAENLQLSEPRGVKSQKVVSSEIKKINVIDSKTADIDISVRVEYTVDSNNGVEKTTSTVSNTYIVRVPISINKGNYAVVSTPVYVADTNVASAVDDIPELEGEAVSMDETEKIEKLASSFFSTYYGGKPSELKYYITKDFGSNATVSGTLKFKEIENCEAVTTNRGYTAKVTIALNDGAVDMSQTCFLDIETGSEGRLYISGLSTR